MGREVKRVPLDFDWPLKKVWEGYIPPEEFRFPECTKCEGTGYTREARAIAETFYPTMIDMPYHGAQKIAWHDKLGQKEVDFLVSKRQFMSYQDSKWVSIPRTAKEVNEAQKAHGPFELQHDGVSRLYAVRNRCELLGIEVDCPKCKGYGNIASKKKRKEAEDWEGIEPPSGEGWQMWENTTEGSPISLVFATPEELAKWLADTNASASGSQTATYEQWLCMIKGTGHAPDAVLADGKLMSGVEAVSKLDTLKNKC